MLTDYFTARAIKELVGNAKGIAGDLFDPKKPGAFAMDAVRPEMVSRLVKEIEQEQHRFRWSEKRYKGKEQNLESFYIGEADAVKYDAGYYPNKMADRRVNVRREFPGIAGLRDAYEVIVRLLGKYGHFDPIVPNSIGVHRYPVHAIGIEPHRDLLEYEDVIGIAKIKGKGRLSVYHEGKRIDLPTAVGALVLLRQHRRPEEKDRRVQHSITDIAEEHVSIVFRLDKKGRRAE